MNDKIKELENIFDNLSILKPDIEDKNKRYEIENEKLKIIEEEIKKDNLITWFEILRLKCGKNDNQYCKINDILFLDFGINANNNTINYNSEEFKKQLNTDIELIKRSIDAIRIDNEDKKEILDIIYNNINKANFINDNINYIIKSGVLNLIKGKFAEYKFVEFLDKKNIISFPIDGSRENKSEALKKINGKRPDVFAVVNNNITIAVDVKNYYQKGNFSINCRENITYTNLKTKFSIPIFLAFSNGHWKFEKWYFISVEILNKKYKEYTKIYNIPIDDFVNIDFNQEFTNSIRNNEMFFTL